MNRNSSQIGRIRPLLLLELNEIPWRLLDLYAGRGCRHLARFMAASETYTTVAVDEGELSPWVTWPSFHRGLSNREHGVRNLGQPPESFGGVPIWEEYRRRGLDVGVFGAMQSWPPKNPGSKGFHVPDTFAHDARCIPSYVEPFQKFNLDQVKRNGRVVAEGTGGSGTLLRSLPRLGIRPLTLASLAAQLAGEKLDPARRARRPVFQTVLSWDIFRKLYRPGNPPAYASFFTNHVAGLMHRYWDHVFPGDFPDRPASKGTPHLATMDFAMRFTDRMIGEAMEWVKRNPEIIMVCASSMGQAAIHRDGHQGLEASIPDLPALMRAFGVEEGYQTLLAMVPQVALEIGSAPVRGRVKADLEASRTRSGAPLFQVDEIGRALSVTIKTPKRDDWNAGGFLRASSSGQEAWFEWERAGIRAHEVDPGTGYHVPEGFLAVHRSDAMGRDTRRSILASEGKALLLGLAGLEAGGPESSRTAPVIEPEPARA